MLPGILGYDDPMQTRIRRTKQIRTRGVRGNKLHVRQNLQRVDTITPRFDL